MKAHKIDRILEPKVVLCSSKCELPAWKNAHAKSNVAQHVLRSTITSRLRIERH